jgi:uncharacterized membrane protein YgcG
LLVVVEVVVAKVQLEVELVVLENLLGAAWLLFSFSFRSTSALPVSVQGYPITVGSGGAGGHVETANAGEDLRKFFNFFKYNITSGGGGGGGGAPGTNGAGAPGGSGGGGGGRENSRVQEILLP